MLATELLETKRAGSFEEIPALLRRRSYRSGMTICNREVAYAQVDISSTGTCREPKFFRLNVGELYAATRFPSPRQFDDELGTDRAL